MARKHEKFEPLVLSLLITIDGVPQKVDLNIQKNVPKFIVNRVNARFGASKSNNPVSFFIENFHRKLLCDPKIDGFWRYVTKQADLNMNKKKDREIVSLMFDQIFEASRKNPQETHDFDVYIKEEFENGDGAIASRNVKKTLSQSAVTSHKDSLIFLALELSNKLNESPVILSRAIRAREDLNDLTLKLAILADLVESIEITSRTPDGKAIPKTKKESSKKIFCRKLIGIFEKHLETPHYGLVVTIGNLLFPEDRITKDIVKAL